MFKPTRNFIIQKDEAIISFKYNCVYSDYLNKVYIRKGINRFVNSLEMRKNLFGNHWQKSFKINSVEEIQLVEFIEISRHVRRNILFPYFFSIYIDH
jgi:hypothetical protein